MKNCQWCLTRLISTIFHNQHWRILISWGLHQRLPQIACLRNRSPSRGCQSWYLYHPVPPYEMEADSWLKWSRIPISAHLDISGLRLALLRHSPAKVATPRNQQVASAAWCGPHLWMMTAAIGHRFCYKYLAKPIKAKNVTIRKAQLLLVRNSQRWQP